MKKTLLICCLFFVSRFVFAQGNEIEKGDIHYEFFQFKEAIDDYEIALKKGNPKVEAYLLDRLAQCYKYSFQYKKAEEYFSKLVRLGDGKAAPDVYLDYGAILKINGDYARAKDQFNFYLTFFPEDPYATAQLKSLSWAVKNKDSIRNFTITPTNLNIGGLSLGYCFFDDGLMYSTTRNKSNGNNTTQLYDLDFAVMKDSITFIEGDKMMDEILFELNEGSPSLSEDGQLVYFSANATKIKNGVVKKKVGAIEISSDGVSNIKIYVAKLVNGKFVSPQELSFNNKEYNCTHPWITDNGNTLYFASDMPKGFGGLDIYKVTKGQDGKWSTPQNLGDKINTTENEMYPFVNSGNFFYASKGMSGFGGYDLFQSKIKSGVLSTPVNMGQPFNSSHDDVAFICKPNGRTGYFSSNRDNGEGNDKVYFFIDNKMLAETKPIVVAAAETKKTKPTFEIAVKKTTPKIISRVSNDELLQLIFDKVYFNFNDASVHASSYITLDSAIQAIHQNKTLKIAVNAYTDSRGSAEYNKALSNKRADAVKQYLLKNGVPASRIITHGLGETQLLNSCTDGVECNDEQHQQNRRVEIKIVK